MRKNPEHTLILICLVPLMFAASTGAAQTGTAPVGFIDENRDGKNDWFQDADGDGINDVNGQAYPHHFAYEDADGDGVNDLWSDADGDGVNDLLSEIQKKSGWIDQDGDGIQDGIRFLRGKALREHVLDMNSDGRNDITLEAYSGKDLKGYQYGSVAEERGQFDPDYRDEDGDGMNDRFGSRPGQGNQFGRRMDQFLDSDGDGIADDRGFGRFGNPGKAKGQGKK